jgi:hypothetical protein
MQYEGPHKRQTCFTIIHFDDSNIKVEKHIDEVIRILKG